MSQPTPVAAVLATRTELLEMVRDVLVDRLKLKVERDQIQPDTPLFGTGLGLDSVDAVDLAVGVEERTRVKLPDDWRGRVALRSVNHLVGFLLSEGAHVAAR